MSSEPLPFVSVIIPTYNRKESLLRTLESLARQSYPDDQFEVIVVDDGGGDGTEVVTQHEFPFSLRYVRQTNQGATVARNRGAAESRGECLVFMDDDIVLGSPALELLINCLTSHTQTVVLGTLHLPLQIIDNSLYARVEGRSLSRQSDEGFVSFQECLTGLLAITRSDFCGVGMFQDPTGGWPNWDDVDFGYRASQAGLRFWRCASVVAEHWDYSVADLGTACERWYRASRAAPRLFQKHPVLQGSIPMFRDKSPIAWRHDSPALILRKLARQIISSPLVLRFMEGLVRITEARLPSPAILRRLYRWIGSAYILRGYREGLKELELRRVSMAGSNV